MKVSGAKDKNLIWILDFDRTLFDTDKLIRDYAATMEKRLAIPKAITAAAKAGAQKKGDIFDFDRQLVLLAKLSGVPLPRIVKESAVFYKTSPKYFFRDTLPFLRSIAKKDHVVLLSYGHIGHQRDKIQLSGIKKYFKKVIVTDAKMGKTQWVRKYLTKSSRVVFVNDHPEETHVILRACVRPWKVILVERPGTKYSPVPPHKDYAIVRDLRKIKSLLY